MLAGYEVTQELLKNDWQVLVRARRVDDQRPVLLKTIPSHSQWLAHGELLEREFQLLKQLSVPGIPVPIEVVSPEVTGERWWLVLEDPGGAPLAELLPARGLGLDAFFQIAIRIANIAGELHRRDIIHRSISTQSVLLNQVNSEVCFADLSLAVRGNETQAAISTNLLRSRLAYSSPEETGRMNRVIDYRTDFYSLGVTFYEMLIGRLPFNSDDSLELVHWHIARTPEPPSAVDSRIPTALSQIIMKLLAKTAENRYQSTAGLRRDLETCAREWASRGQIAVFELGQHDVSDRFLIPQRLFGRETEVQSLLSAFDRTCAGQTAMMLVAGYSGIGKTSLIQELYRPIVRERGYFISGKFDQVARGVPFGAMIQAFRGLVRQLLTESEASLASWRAKLTKALGTQGGVLTEVIPEIELIVGKQPPLPNVGPTEALNRFQLVFQHFVGAIAQRDHPLVVFLDDLQWADAATLGLLGPLVTGSRIESLFLIGAYRDNEVDSAHPLTRALAALESSGDVVRRLTLGPLQLSDLTRFVSETLRSTPGDAEPLAKLVLGKTAGNPFFVIQFLKTLKQDGFLTFDYDRSCWCYGVHQIGKAATTDNVIDLMTGRIERLSPETQKTLTLASCIGNSFDQQAIATVSQLSLQTAAAHLEEALQQGLIVPDTAQYESEGHVTDFSQSVPRYAFLHDRVQQAAYAMIPEERKQLVHLAVGRLLQNEIEAERTEEKLFDVVHHLNLGRGKMTDQTERLLLASLNLKAGRRAKSSTAHAAALEYFRVGKGLIPEDQWEPNYDLAFSLRLEAVECQRLCADLEGLDEEYEVLLRQARTKLDQARVHSLRILQYENQSRYADALSTAQESLALFDISFPSSKEEQQAAVESEILEIESLLGEREISSLIELPVMTDPEVKMVMSTLTTIWSSAYISGEQTLTRLISATMVRLSLVHGNAEESAYGYATHAITVGPVLAEYESAYEFGVLALRVNERFNDSRLRAKICQQFQAHVTLWRRPLHTCLTYAQEARRSGFESGDFTYGAYGAFTETWAAIVITQNLSQYVRDYTPDLDLYKNLKVASVGDGAKVMLNWARALEGKTLTPSSLSDDDFDESAYVAKYRDNPFYTMFYTAAKLHLSYLLGEYEQALEAALNARQVVQFLTGTIWTVIVDFWSGLTLAANFADASPEEQESYLEQLHRSRAAFAVLTENCAENYRCQWLLLSAEIDRIQNKNATAEEAYDLAILYAETTNNLQHRALANELAAKFHLGRGHETVASVMMSRAHACYSLWGARAKVEVLERDYAGLLHSHYAISTGSFPNKLGGVAPLSTRIPAAETYTDDGGSLDLFSVLKASQAIAGDMEMESLLARLIRIAIENAGAERGYLLLERDGELFLHAEGSVDKAEAQLHNPIALSETERLPISIVNFVRRTSEAVVLPETGSDPAGDHGFDSDPYILRFKPRSVMCVPVINQGRSIGVLYLENNLADGAFTRDRIRVCQVLASQAAISLDNARLYAEMRTAEETLRSITEGTAAVTGGDFFASLVRHLARALQVRYAFVTECRERVKLSARTLAFWTGDRLADNVTYEIAETPCLKVLAGETCYYPAGVQQLFPNDRDLADLSVIGYLGIPMCNAAGAVIGHLAVLDDKPMTNTPQRLSLLTIFAARAGAELERLHAEQELRTAMEEVERLKNRLHAENVYLQEEIRREHNFEEIVGSSPSLLAVLQQVERVAPTDATVLILGETGTGKELIARAIHDRSRRRTRPLVKVNCGAMSAALVESELFGHVKGAFTGAIEKRTGRFELADGGTLFLDEVSELTQETQVKLLRVLQEGEFEPVGSSKTVKVDVRIIAATNRSLAEEVKASRFRADLFYRLNVLPLHNPPLRERKHDIPQLATFFLSRFSRRFGRQFDGISQETIELMTEYDWPGNIRELQNLIERGVVLSNHTVLSIDPSLLQAVETNQTDFTGKTRDLMKPLERDKLTLHSTESLSDPSGLPLPPSRPGTSLKELERHHIITVLKQANWVIEGEHGAAKALSLHPNTLRSRLKKMGIHRPQT